MTPLKTIVATAVIAVGGTVAAFSGLHIGQPEAGAAGQAPKAGATYTVTLTAEQLATLMHGRTDGAVHKAKDRQRHVQRTAARDHNRVTSSRSSNGSPATYGSRNNSGNGGDRYNGNGSYRCYGNGGSRSGGWGGGCW